MEFRYIKQEETEQAISIEQICFPPNEACKPENMRRRIEKASDYFLAAIDPETGKLAGFFNGIATNENRFRDEFFTEEELHDSRGKNAMMLGLDVLPEYRGKGLARRLVAEYAKRAKERNMKALFLTCLADKVEMYLKFGFEDLGIADSSWGGEEWHEMRYDL